MVYFAHYSLKTNAAIMVTGSHNPPEYNGFKMVLKSTFFFCRKYSNASNLVDDPKLLKRRFL